MFLVIGMKKEINLNGTTIDYILEYKKVKNINLRIKSDGRIYVSAGRFISQKRIEELLHLKTDFILNAIKTFKEREEKTTYFTQEELKKIIINLCRNIYPYFEKLGVEYPQIKFRKMKSQWGNCYYKKGVITFSTNLVYAPLECIEYVVCHEFVHFIESNHSPKFYEQLSKIMPDWKERRKKLKNL